MAFCKATCLSDRLAATLHDRCGDFFHESLVAQQAIVAGEVESRKGVFDDGTAGFHRPWMVGKHARHVGREDRMRRGGDLLRSTARGASPLR